MAKAVLFAGSLLAWSPHAFALDPTLDVSQYAHTSWKIREGFAKGGITSIAQTPDGYLWLGTEFGLIRFDGVRPVPWQPPPGQNLTSREITSLLTARDGTLWIATGKGLASWKGGILTQYPELSGRKVMKLFEDHDGTVWLGTTSIPAPGRLCAVRDAHVQCFGEDGSLGIGVVGLFEDTHDALWVGGATGLWRWKPGPPKFYPLPGHANGISGLAEDRDGSLLISMGDGVRRLVGDKVEMAYPFPDFVRQFEATRLLWDRDGGLWIGTRGRGLIHIHHGRTDVFAQSDGLSSENVSNLIEDREGNIWVGTFDGLDRFHELAVPTVSVKQGLSTALVWSVVAATDGSVWIGTNGDLNRWQNGQVTSFQQREGTHGGVAGRCLFQDSRQRIWISTPLAFGYLENDRFIPVDGIPGGTVNAITEDAAGNLWVADEDSGLFQLSHGSVVQRIPWATLGLEEFAISLAPDPVQGGLWLGLKGVIAHFIQGKVGSSYSAADGLGEGWVSNIRVEQDGTLWAATEGGLSRLKDGRIATVGSDNGLPCDGVYWMLEDEAHAAWLYLTCGLVRIAHSELDASLNDPKRNIQFTLFDNSDGVRISATFFGYGPHVAKTSDGKLWFRSLDGVSVIDPKHLAFNAIPSPVRIEQIAADRKSYKPPSDAKGQLHLPPLIHDLEIDYTALSLVAPEKVRFRYKLEGWDQDWQDVGDRRTAFYNNLPPRNYRFRVMASNNSGVWNEAGALVDFSVGSAYYQTAWFRSLMVIIAATLLWTVYRYRLQRLAHEFDVQLQGRVDERTRIARDLHDTLLQSFHGLLFRFQAATNMLPDRPSEAKQKLERAISQAAQALTEGRDAVQNLRSAFGDTEDLALALIALSRELAQTDSDGVVASPAVDVAVRGAARALNPVIRDDVYRIAGEALRNAFRHGHARHIEVEIRYDEKELQVRIRDDGRGIDSDVLKERAHSHFGLPGMRERADIVGGCLDVWTQAGIGTEVDLKVPRRRAYVESQLRTRSWWHGRRADG